MDRVHMLLREKGHKSDFDDSKVDIEHDKTKSKYKTGLTKDMTKLSPKPTKKTYHKERREADSERSATNRAEDLPMTIIEYRIDMDKGLLRTIVLDLTNTLFEKYTKGKPKPKPYQKADRWVRPLAKAPGGRSLKVEVNKFSRLISKEIKEDITRSDMEGKVLEVG
jgi:hypothetical protein